MAAIVPVSYFYADVYPMISTWAADRNVMFVVAWYTLWISGIVLYGLPLIIGPFTWFWNAYLDAGYVAWTQYLIVWGGTGMQAINFAFMIAGAATYDDIGSDGGLDSRYYAWMMFLTFFILTGAIYDGYWMLNDYFLSYYAIEIIINILKVGNQTTLVSLMETDSSSTA